MDVNTDFDAECEAALVSLAAEGLPENLGEEDRSHDALALEMGRPWVTKARYVRPWDKWVFWDDQCWRFDEKLLHFTLAREFLRQKGVDLIAWAEAQREALIKEHGETKGNDKAESLVDWAKGEAKMMRAGPFIAHVVGLARSNAELVGTIAQWDANPDLLGTPGGTVDLRTGELREPRREDFITKQTSVVPAPAGTPAPIWQAFLTRIFQHDLELVDYIQRALGYSLTGHMKEHALLFPYGQGGNGKGVLLNTASRILGIGIDGYAAIAPGDLLLVTQSDRHPCDLAMLRGARLVTAQELAAGRAWDEPKLKSLTGGDPITARHMRQDFFTYEPQFTLFVAGNTKPSFKGVDEAIRRRVHLVPFLQNIPASERDPELPAKLKAEWPAILRWMIDGCLLWQRDGLKPPVSVRVATDDYLNAEDVLGQWLDEKCIVAAMIGWTSLATLYGAWQIWCEARGQHPGTSTALSKKLDERGFQRTKTKHGAGFLGVGLASAAGAGDGSDSSPIIDRMCAHAHSHNAEYGTDRHHRHPAGMPSVEIDL